MFCIFKGDMIAIMQATYSFIFIVADIYEQEPTLGEFSVHV